MTRSYIPVAIAALFPQAVRGIHWQCVTPRHGDGPQIVLWDEEVLGRIDEPALNAKAFEIARQQVVPCLLARADAITENLRHSSLTTQVSDERAATADAAVRHIRKNTRATILAADNDLELIEAMRMLNEQTTRILDQLMADII